MNDEEREKMRKRYRRLANAEVLLARDLAHAYKGDGPSCAGCNRWRSHPFHLCPDCKDDVELDANAVCPTCGSRA